MDGITLSQVDCNTENDDAKISKKTNNDLDIISGVGRILNYLQHLYILSNNYRFCKLDPGTALGVMLLFGLDLDGSGEETA